MTPKKVKSANSCAIRKAENGPIPAVVQAGHAAGVCRLGGGVLAWRVAPA